LEFQKQSEQLFVEVVDGRQGNNLLSSYARPTCSERK